MSAARQAGRRRRGAGQRRGRTLVRDAVGRRVRMAAGLLILAELAVFVLVASLDRRGLDDPGHPGHQRAGLRAAGPAGHQGARRPPGAGRGPAARPAGNSATPGWSPPGACSWCCPGFLGDLVGLLCLLPVTRGLVRARADPPGAHPAARRTARARCGSRACARPGWRPAPATDAAPLVIEGEIVRGPDGRPLI